MSLSTMGINPPTPAPLTAVPTPPAKHDILSDLAKAFGTRALSIQQPWNWAILHAGKSPENRSWTTDHRGPLLTHAGKVIRHEDVDEVAELAGCPVPDDLPTGVLTALVVLTDIHHADECGCCCSPWAQPNQYHWELEQPHAFVQPFPVRGLPSLWTPLPGQMKRIA